MAEELQKLPAPTPGAPSRYIAPGHYAEAQQERFKAEFNKEFQTEMVKAIKQAFAGDFKRAEASVADMRMALELWRAELKGRA